LDWRLAGDRRVCIYEAHIVSMKLLIAFESQQLRAILDLGSASILTRKADLCTIRSPHRLPHFLNPPTTFLPTPIHHQYAQPSSPSKQKNPPFDVIRQSYATEKQDHAFFGALCTMPLPTYPSDEIPEMGSEFWFCFR